MDKIYTRHRFRIPTIKTNLRGPPKKVFGIIFIITGCTILGAIAIKAVYPVFNNLCEDRAKTIATTISNEQATEVMRKYSYNNLFEVEKDEEGNVKMLKSNIFTINEIISDIAVRIQKEIDETGKGNIGISLGTFTGSKLLSGIGPTINIKISTMGNVETDLKSEFEAQGINQTLHRVYLQIKCEIIVLTPFKNIDSSITNQVLLAENVIVGNIPETFYNFSGVDEQDYAIETLN